MTISTFWKKNLKYPLKLYLSGLIEHRPYIGKLYDHQYVAHGALEGLFPYIVGSPKIKNYLFLINPYYLIYSIISILVY